MNEESQTNPELDDFIDDVLSGAAENAEDDVNVGDCLLYTSPSPRDRQKSRMPSSA